MKALALGKVNVPTGGTPVPITAALLANAGLGPNHSIYRMDVGAIPGSTGITYLKQVSTGNIIKAFLVPSTGFCDHLILEDESGNQINPFDLSIDSVSNNDGLYITVWVE